MRSIHLGQLGLIGLCVTASSIAWSAPMTPFTQVNDVCPACTGGPAFDQVQLKSGQVIRARLVSENERFYVIERFGELRALDRDQVTQISKNPSADRPTGFPDQILLKSGIVLAGTISGDIAQDAPHFDITTPRTAVPLHSAEHSTVAAIYRAGKQVYAAK